MAEMRQTKREIISFIKSKGQSTADDVASFFDISRQIVHRHLTDLVKKNLIYKIGKPPKVFYLITPYKKEVDMVHIESSVKKLIDENFLVITPAGEREEGFKGFVYWCNKQNLAIEKTALEYEQTFKKISSIQKRRLD